MKIILILLMLVNTACASNKKLEDVIRISPKYDGIHEEFKPYVQEFKYKSKGLISDFDLNGLTIGFRDYDKDSPTVGTCWPAPWFREIDISRKWWNKHKSQFEREQLIFHELGHCILYRHHTQPTTKENFWGWLERTAFDLGIFKKSSTHLSDGCPSSYMHKYTLSEKCITRHYKYYNKELFNYREILVEEVTEEIVHEN